MLCGLLVLVLLIQRPTAWLALLALVVLCSGLLHWHGACSAASLRKLGGPVDVRRQLCKARKLQFSLEPLSQPAVAAFR